MADWIEIKRLAADFQKAQLSSTAQRLSERNCVEIVSWLIQKKIIDLIFTSDGKEYVTPSHLIHDIKSELYVNGGRVNLVELAKSIGIDLGHVTAHVNDVIRSQKDTHFILGQLIDGSYITRIAGEINEKLQQQGQINISDLTIQYDLPADFLLQHVEKHVGKIIRAIQDKSDPKVFFTESFIARSKAKIRGALMGLTIPTPVNVIVHNIGVSDKLFFTLFDSISVFGVLTNKISSALYIPNVYSRSQNEWINNFYKQNNYVEFDALKRLGITEYKTYLTRQFSGEDIVYLNSCIISKHIIDQLEADVDECISSKSYIDIENNLPSVLYENDIKIITDRVLINQRNKLTVALKNYILSRVFIDNLIKDCESLMQEKAKNLVESGEYQQYQTELQVSSSKHHKVENEIEDAKVDKREERRKKASSGKSGGGAQGRETKTKSTKKSIRGTKVNDTDDHDISSKKVTLEAITSNDIENVVQRAIEEDSDELVNAITSYVLPILNEKVIEISSNLYAETVSNVTANRRQTHNDVQSKLNVLLGDIRLFEKGSKLLSLDVQTQVQKYLLKTLCTNIVNEMLNYAAADSGYNSSANNLTNEQKIKFVSVLPIDYKNCLITLVKSLSEQNVEKFMTAAEEALIACSMILKKVDKKKDRVLILNHKHGLLDQLSKCDDPALVLHLATLVIFISATQNMIHASGRHISGILAFLKQYLTAEQAAELTSYYDLVTLALNKGSEAEQTMELLLEKMSVVKAIATEYKKFCAEKN